MKKKVSFQRALIEYGVPVFALLLLFSVASIIVPIQKTNAAGDISGTVFLDYNSNGTRDVSGVSPNYAVDKGVSGITVTVFDSSGIARGSDVSDANGNYT
ncbi:MAG: hypothetical protein HKN33_17265, partial [Pyrinomonadaceae bacterium]|nr:hypothetical protein [Pyrinomonadaceae bacterium]